jgi:small conductance mechanosensitive channel
METLVDYFKRFATLCREYPELKAAIVFFVFLFLAYFVCYVINKMGKKTRLNEHIASLLARTAKLVLMLFGIMSTLGTLGVDITAMVASLGLTGFALGFALKDTVSNLLAGILILMYRPLDIGDEVKLLAYTGTVISIDLRYTTLVSDGKKVLIPNSKLLTDPVTIFDKKTD